MADPEAVAPPPPQQWMVVRKRETDPPEVWIFDRSDEAAMHWDAVQAQWSDVYFCRVAYGPNQHGTGMIGQRPEAVAPPPQEHKP